MRSASSPRRIVFDPVPVERTDGRDFFGNAVVSVAYRDPHAKLERRDERPGGRDAMRAPCSMCRRSWQRSRTNWAACCRWRRNRRIISRSPARASRLMTTITAYARQSVVRCGRPCARSCAISAIASTAISATTSNRPRSRRCRRDAFALRRGVCQDFSHVMIAGLRGIGIPAGYVSGFLRTIPAARRGATCRRRCHACLGAGVVRQRDRMGRL